MSNGELFKCAMAFAGMALVLVACGGAAKPAATLAPAALTPTTGGAAATSTPAPARASPTATAAPKAQPKFGGTLRPQFAVQAGRVDPAAHQGVYGNSDIWSLIGDTLTRNEWTKGVLQPGLAESWEFNSPTELIMHIRKGVKFQRESLAKGREMDATDVAMSVARTLRPFPFQFTIQMRLVDKIEATDASTVRVTFKKPDANFLYYMSHPAGGVVLPREIMEKFPKEDQLLQGDEMWYGTGPFVIDYSVYRQDLAGAANRNPNYWGKDAEGRQTPYLDRVQWILIKDISSRAAALRTGQIDIDQIPFNEKPSFDKAGFSIYTTEDLIVASAGVGMNVNIFPTNDWRVRKAINLAMDKEELRLVVADGYGCLVIILGCKPEWFLGEKDFAGQLGILTKDRKKDIADAKALLRQAGVDPAAMTLHIVAPAASGGSSIKTTFEQSQVIITNLQNDLGFKVEREVVAGTNSSTDGAKKHGFPLTMLTRGGIGGLVIDYALWDGFHSQAPYNPSQWADSKTDELTEQQQSTLDIGQRKELLHQIQRYLLSDGQIPGGLVIRNYDYFGSQPKVRGYEGSAYFLSPFAWQFGWTWLEK